MKTKKGCKTSVQDYFFKQKDQRVGFDLVNINTHLESAICISEQNGH